MMAMLRWNRNSKNGTKRCERDERLRREGVAGDERYEAFIEAIMSLSSAASSSVIGGASSSSSNKDGNMSSTVLPCESRMENVAA